MIKRNIKSFLLWLGTFWDNSSNGGSIRKVIAVWAMILVTSIHLKYLDYTVKNNGDFDFAQTLLYCDYTMIASLLGLIVLQKLVDLFINLKLGKQEEPKTKDETTPPTENN